MWIIYQRTVNVLILTLSSYINGLYQIFYLNEFEMMLFLFFIISVYSILFHFITFHVITFIFVSFSHNFLHFISFFPPYSISIDLNNLFTFYLHSVSGSILLNNFQQLKLTPFAWLVGTFSRKLYFVTSTNLMFSSHFHPRFIRFDNCTTLPKMFDRPSRRCT